jgi:hypothetical protein
MTYVGLDRFRALMQPPPANCGWHAEKVVFMNKNRLRFYLATSSTVGLLSNLHCARHTVRDVNEKHVSPTCRM